MNSHHGHLSAAPELSELQVDSGQSPTLTRPLPEIDWNFLSSRGLTQTGLLVLRRGDGFDVAPASSLSHLPSALCLICCEPGQERGIYCLGLCLSHHSQWLKASRSGEWPTIAQWILATNPKPLPGLGRCGALVASNGARCLTFQIGHESGLCSAHLSQWSIDRRRDPAAAPTPDVWNSSPHPVRTPSNFQDLRGLTDLVRNEVCFAIEHRLRAGYQVKMGSLKSIIGVLSVRQPPLRTLADLTDEDFADVEAKNAGAVASLRLWQQTAELACLTVEGALARGAIPLAVLDPKHAKKDGSAYLDLTGLQNDFAATLLRRQIGTMAANGKSEGAIRHMVLSVRWWDKFLATLGKSGPASEWSKAVVCDQFCVWLERREAEERELDSLPDDPELDTPAQSERRQALLSSRPFVNDDFRADDRRHLKMTTSTRRRVLMSLNTLFTDQRPMLGALGGCAATWHIDDSRIPRHDAALEDTRQRTGVQPEDRPLPLAVFAQLRRQIPLLGEDGNLRNSVELILHTGRRPIDLVRIPFDCLVETSYVQDGERRQYFNLHYTDGWKKKRPTVVDLPLFDEAVATVKRQQEWVRRTYPHWFDEHGNPLRTDLFLFPAANGNPNGTRHITPGSVGTAISVWTGRIKPQWKGGVTAIPDLTDADGKPWRRNITPYSLRHTFGQQLHDAGVPLDVIQQLMGHDDISNTQVYARVTAKDLHGAIKGLHDLRSATVSKSGQVVMLPLPKLKSHQAITRAAIPFGGCAEKGNVAAHGRACPNEGACLNCTEFRADASDLPQLEAALSAKDRMLIRAKNGLLPEGPHTDALTALLELERYRLDDMVSKLRDELRARLTPEELREVEDLLDLQRRIQVEILGPLGRKPEYRPLGFTLDENIQHPAARDLS